MDSYDLLIESGMVFGAGEPRPMTLALQGGRVAAHLPPGTAASAAKRIDASGLFVAPGFVDTHMHDEYFDEGHLVLQTLKRQGVTTAVGGHCGMGVDYAEAMSHRTAPPINLTYMVGNCALREAAGHSDRYSPCNGREIALMTEALRRGLATGAKGLSFGLEYAPGTSREEIKALAAIVAEYDERVVSIHIRFDDDRCVDATREAVNIAREQGVRLQVSHLHSMTMTHTRECVQVIESGIAEGLDLGFDCYPYEAFCAKAGSAVFDDSYRERWHGLGAECLEPTGGPYKGRRLTHEQLQAIRRDAPTTLIVAHVIDGDEVDYCLTRPDCLVASDAVWNGGGAHPRIAGTFPRALMRLRRLGFSWQDALAKVTSLPAKRLHLDAGTLALGAAADLVIFDPERLTDRASYQDPFAEPEGIHSVLVRGV